MKKVNTIPAKPSTIMPFGSLMKQSPKPGAPCMLSVQPLTGQGDHKNYSLGCSLQMILVKYLQQNHLLYTSLLCLQEISRNRIKDLTTVWILGTDCFCSGHKALQPCQGRLGWCNVILFLTNPPRPTDKERVHKSNSII